MAKSGTNRFNKIMTKGVIQEKRERMEVLEVQIENLTRDISYALLMDDGVESIDLRTANVQVPDLEAKVEEYLKLKKEIEDLET